MMRKVLLLLRWWVGSAFILELLLYPAIYAVWRERHLNQELEHHSLLRIP
jgi:hypothetical protein